VTSECLIVDHYYVVESRIRVYY